MQPRVVGFKLPQDAESGELCYFHHRVLAAQRGISNRCGEEDGRECTEDDTKNHGKREGADAVATKEEDAKEHQECGERSHDGTAQRAVERVVEETTGVAGRMESEVLTHTVKDNHFVVDGVTDSRQHRADEGLIHFEREGNPAPADGVHSQNQQRVEDECHGGTDGERHVAEADENVDEDGSEGKEHTGDGAFCHVGSHCRSNLLGRNDGTSGVVVTVNEGGVVSVDELGIVESVKDEAFHFLVNVLAVIIDAIVGRETNCLIVSENLPIISMNVSF